MNSETAGSVLFVNKCDSHRPDYPEQCCGKVVLLNSLVIVSLSIENYKSLALNVLKCFKKRTEIEEHSLGQRHSLWGGFGCGTFGLAATGTNCSVPRQRSVISCRHSHRWSLLVPYLTFTEIDEDLLFLWGGSARV